MTMNYFYYSQCFPCPHASEVDEAPVTEDYGGGLSLGFLWHHTAQYWQLV